LAYVSFFVDMRDVPSWHVSISERPCQ
jgi:hypothetical protein